METPRPELWPSSGFRLLARDAGGYLRVTDDFLRAYLARPEISPVAESCAAERALHRELLGEPRMPVPEARIAGLRDSDARDNYRVLLGFRDRLLAAATVEACYIAAFREKPVGLAPLFIDQMAEVILRNALADTNDAFRARAAELLFREQTVLIREGSILLGDTETVEMLATTRGAGSLGRLLVEGGAPVRQIDLDVLTNENAALYWPRNDRHDIVLDVSFARPGLDALARVLEIWVRHLLMARVRITPVQKIRDERWVWHVGLDAEASSILNDLYNEVEVGEERMERLLSLFRLEFEDASLMRPDIAGRPIYLGIAMSPEKRLKLKPQNLIVNLPLAKGA